jgi:hypothetical protein
MSRLCGGFLRNMDAVIFLQIQRINEVESGRERLMKQIELFRVQLTPCPCIERLARNKKRGEQIAPLCFKL